MKKTCSIRNSPFSISEAELAIYDSLAVSLPTLCSPERARKRLAWRNERILYRRPCDATGKSIVSIFDVDAPFPVYSQDYWWSDNWDALEYGREFDFQKSFFEQWLELFNVVPQCALRCPQSENSEYTNQCEKNKDCYLVFCSNGSRECLHGMWYQTCIESVDCTYLEKSELCCEILNGKHCYRCTHSENLQNCSNCHFSRDLIGCSNCLGCVNLRHKKYCWFNEQLSEKEYKKRLLESHLDTHSSTASLLKRFKELSQASVYKYYNGKQNEGFSGDYLENNKNAINCFNCRNSENIYHCRDAWSGRNSIDLTETLDQDYCVEIEGCYKTSTSGFSAKNSETHNAWYCSHCFSSKNLFGCVGIRRKQFCILNKQYSPEEYTSLQKRIVSHMKETEEWGQYFPIDFSPFAYNESVAYEYFPLSREEVVARGWRWKDPASLELSGDSTEIIPDSILEVSDDILDSVLICEQSAKPFKIQKAELSIYRKLGIPLPRLHPDVRHSGRMARRNPRRLAKLSCSNCKANLLTTFTKENSAKMLCSSCYNDQF